MARSKLTPHLQDTLCGLIADGHTQAAACAACGLGHSAFHNWLSRGRTAKRGIYGEFVEATQKASAQWEQSHLDNIKAAATQPSISTKHVVRIAPDGRETTETTTTETAPVWTASAWLLERRVPDRYSRRVVQVEGEVKNTFPHAMRIELVKPSETPPVHMPESNADDGDSDSAS